MELKVIAKRSRVVRTYHLELAEEEALAIAALCGRVNGNITYGNLRSITDRVYDAIKSEMPQDVFECLLGTELVAGQLNTSNNSIVDVIAIKNPTK